MNTPETPETPDAFVETDVVTKLANQVVVKRIMADGIQAFRLDPMDVNKLDVRVADTTGRYTILNVFGSTVLIMVPMPVLGTVIFDPIEGMRDEEGRPIFLERTPMSRPETMTIIEQFTKSDRKVILPNGR